MAALVLVLGACSSGSGTATSTTTAPGTENPTTLPSHFVTFVDKAQHFTISYPGDWEVIPGNEPSQSIDPDPPAFEAGRTTADGELGLPTVEVVFDFLPQATSSDDFAESNLLRASGLEGFVIHDRRHVTVVGVEEEATIVEVEFPASPSEPGVGTIRGVIILSAAGHTVRRIGCFFDTDLDLDTCRAVATSFGITTPEVGSPT